MGFWEVGLRGLGFEGRVEILGGLGCGLWTVELRIWAFLRKGSDSRLRGVASVVEEPECGKKLS